MADPNKLPAKTIVGHIVPAGDRQSIVTRGLEALQNPDRKAISPLSETDLRNLLRECYDRGDYEEALQLILSLPDQTSAFVEALFWDFSWLTSDLIVPHFDGWPYNPEEWPRAVAALRSAAERGHTVAQEVLGEELLRAASEGVLDDGADATAEAVRWLHEAAEKGRKRAQFTLGQRYYEGGDYGEANRWFRKVATSRADPDIDAIDAQVKLAGMCYKGEGVARYRVQAFMWVTIALKQYPLTLKQYPFFAEEAEGLRNQIVMELTQVEIVEAEQRAKTWLESHAS